MISFLISGFIFPYVSVTAPLQSMLGAYQQGTHMFGINVCGTTAIWSPSLHVQEAFQLLTEHHGSQLLSVKTFYVRFSLTNMFPVCNMMSVDLNVCR